MRPDAEGGAWGQPRGGTGDTLVLSRATVIDGRGGAPLADHTVVVRHGRISEVGPTARVSIPPSARVVDLHGQFLLPGLVDAHAHLGAERASIDRYLRFLFNGGITAVRDMAGDSFLYAQLGPGANDAATPLPRLHYSANWAGPSFWDDRRWVGSTQGKAPGEASWARAITATSDLMAEAAAARALGVTGIKVYSDLPPEIVARVPVVASLAGPEDGNAADCLTEFEAGKFPTGERGIVQRILNNPSNFYINVHNPEYPAGAIRGQLERE